MASIDNTLKGLGPCLAQVNKVLERLDQRLAPVVPPRNELAPYLAQVNKLLERLTVESIRTQRLAPVVPPRPQPRAVPTSTTIPNDVKIQSDNSTYRESGTANVS